MQFDPDYRLNQAISQSDIKLFETNIIGFYNRKILGISEEQQSDPMDIGSMVDAKIIIPSELKKYYVVTDLKATGKLQDVVDIVWKSCLANTPEIGIEKLAIRLEDYKDLISKAMDAIEYQMNWKYETRLNKIITEGAEYFEQLQEANGLYMVSLENWNLAMSTVDTTVKNATDIDQVGTIIKILMGYIVNKDITVKRQVVLYGEYEGSKQKCQIDFMIINESHKTIQVGDLKTSPSHAGFLRNYKKFKYGRQAAYYTDIVKQNFPGYDLSPFMFLVIPIDYDKHKRKEEAVFERPEIYLMGSNELQVYTEGFTFDSGFEIKGWKQLLKDIEWHYKTNQFFHNKAYYENGYNILNTLKDGILFEEGEQAPLY